jgi:hypothetical protein
VPVESLLMQRILALTTLVRGFLSKLRICVSHVCLAWYGLPMDCGRLPVDRWLIDRYPWVIHRCIVWACFCSTLPPCDVACQLHYSRHSQPRCSPILNRHQRGQVYPPCPKVRLLHGMIWADELSRQRKFVTFSFK